MNVINTRGQYVPALAGLGRGLNRMVQGGSRTAPTTAKGDGDGDSAATTGAWAEGRSAACRALDMGNSPNLLVEEGRLNRQFRLTGRNGYA